MKFRRLLISIVAVLLISLAAVISFSADEGQFEIAVGVSSSTAISKDGALCVSADNEIELAVSITSNPGFQSFQIDVAYDPELVAPVVDNNGHIVVSGNFISGLNANKKSEGIVTLNRMEANDSKVNATGTLKIRFKVLNDACGDVEFSIVEARATQAVAGSIIPNNLITKSQKDSMNAYLASNTFAAHDYALTSTDAPTCEEYGVRHYTCESCGATLDKQGEAPVGHTPVREEDKQTSCSEAGYIGATICSVCSKTLYDRVEIPMIAHTVVDVKGTDATCDAAGKTDGKQCSACKTWIEEQKEIPSLHSQVEAGEECSACGEKVGSGCKSAIGMGAIVIIAISCAAIPVFKKRKH